MPHVPQYNNQVSPDVATVPNAPSPDHNGNLRALNSNLQANENIAESVSGIGKLLAHHAQKQINLQNDQLVANAYSQFDKDQQNALYSKEQVTVKENGQDVTRYKGEMLNELSSANGAIQRVDKNYFSSRQNYLDQVSNSDSKAKLSMMIDSKYNSIRDNVMVHEAKQLQRNDENIKEGAIKQIQASMFASNTPEQMKTDLINLGTSVDAYNKTKQIDPVNSAINKQKAYADGIENAVMGKLNTTGDTVQANALLDSVKDQLLSENYAALQGRIKKVGDSLEKKFKEDNTRLMTANRLDMTMKVANGQLTFDNSGQIVRTVMQNDPQLAEAMTKSIDSGGIYQPTDNNNEAFQKNALDIFNAGTPEEIGKFVIKALNDNGEGKIGRDRLAIIVNAAQQRAKNFLPDGTRTPTQISIDGGMDAINRWNVEHGNNDPETQLNYMKSIQANKTPKEAYDAAIRTTILKQHPETSANEDVPNIVVSKDSPKKYIFTGSTKIAPHRIYQPDKQASK